MVTKHAKPKARPDAEVDDFSGDEGLELSDPEDFVDDINDEELLADLYKQQPAEAAGLESVIVVDNVPVVGEERIEKLRSVLQKIFGQFGDVNSWEMPVEDDGKTKGYMFVEYNDVESASRAIEQANGYKLDKQHTFAVCALTDFQKYDQMHEDWKPPQPQPYASYGDLHYYLKEPECRDQFVVMSNFGKTTTVNLFGAHEDTEIITKEAWTDQCLQWSPRGTYMATFHDKGVILWGGENWERIMRLQHFKVRHIDFSPCEKYIVTISEGATGKTKEADVPEEDRKASIIVWDILTGQKRRTFAAGDEEMTWPVFKWSHDDRYFSRQGTDQISVYETPSCGLLDKKSIRIPGIKGFSWCPTQNVMAYWVSEDKDVPARVTLVEIPSRKELRSKNLFNVADCKMSWQKNGDFLAVKVDRYQKAKREGNQMKYTGMYFNFEIFMMRQKNIPVDSTELKDSCITHVAWEPNGSKFAVVHGDAPQASVSFFQVKGENVILLKKLEKKTCNRLYWSPNGKFIVLAAVKHASNGTLEFIDTTSDFSLMSACDHFRMTDVEWDPTGRYVVTSVSAWVATSDHCYQVWSFQGKLIKKLAPPGFCSFQWRPRPKTLLIDEHLRDIKKNFKKYQSEFEVKDRASKNKVSKDIMEKRQTLMEAHKAWLNEKAILLAAQREKRLELRGVDTDNMDKNAELDVEDIFVLIKEDTQLVSNAA